MPLAFYTMQFSRNYQFSNNGINKALSCFQPATLLEGIPTHPTLSALATVLLLYGACVRGYHGFRRQWAQFTGCVSVNANTSLVTMSGRCGARRMYQTFADMVAANCSNCDNARYVFIAAPRGGGTLGADVGYVRGRTQRFDAAATLHKSASESVLVR
nr:uncharacterized protein LOC126522652 isoform X2 [Dermacentor andersoni]